MNVTILQTDTRSPENLEHLRLTQAVNRKACNLLNYHYHFKKIEEKYYSIAEFYIKPNFRQQGYGKSLLNYILKFCKEQGKHSSIIADSFIKNSITKNFWIANGFYYY